MKQNNTKSSKGAEYWTQRISDQEMPALCSTVKTLEKLAKDDVSSLSLLGKSVMHDNALTSRILRVANSATYSKGISQVTTVSRAAVVLGFDTIRNICITAKLLSSLLESKSLSTSVYQRLLKLMARAFQAAMLAKMMLKDHDEELQEEVFIASLLYHLGESAFWSTGCDEAVLLDELLAGCSDVKEERQLIRDNLGASFNQLSQGIARTWGLGEVLQKSLKNPNDRTPEIRCIFLANQISEVMAQDEVDVTELNNRLKQTADMLDIEVDELKGRMIRCANATKKLADAYGAKVLLEHMPDTKSLQLGGAEEVAEEQVPSIRTPDPSIQLKKLKQLTHCAIEKSDFNHVITISLEGILEGVGVDRCGVLLLSPNRKKLQPRVILGEEIEQMKREFVITLEKKCLFSDCIELKKPMFIDNPTSAKWRLYINDKLKGKISAHGFMLAPIVISNKVIGIIYADRSTSKRGITTEDYEVFTHFSELTNLCLGVSMSRA